MSRPRARLNLASWLCTMIFLLVMAGLPHLAQAQPSQATATTPDHVVHDISISKGYWLSPNRNERLASVEAQTFKPFRDLISLSYEKNDLWVRLEVPASSHALYLHVQPFWLDELEYHDPYTHQAPQMRGDRHLLNGISNQQQDHAFQVAPAPVVRMIYLRVRSSSAYLVYPQVLTAEGLNHAEKNKLLYSSIYLGIFVALTLIILQALIISKDLLIGIFAIKHICYTLYALFTLGMFQLIVDIDLENRFIDKAHIFSIFGISHGTCCTGHIVFYFVYFHELLESFNSVHEHFTLSATNKTFLKHVKTQP